MQRPPAPGEERAAEATELEPEFARNEEEAIEQGAETEGEGSMF